MADRQVESEVSGVVVRIECQPGAELAPGDAIVIVESMKMEIAIEAPARATLSSVLVEVGEAVDEGQVVAVIALA